MQRGKIGIAAVAFALLTAGASSSALAQNQPGGNQPGGNQPGGRDRGNRGNYDPTAMRARMMEQFKTQLGASDDEWKVLQPKLEKVMDASRASRSDRGGFGGDRGGRTRGGDNNGGTPPTPTSTTPESEVSKASKELRAAADNKASTPEECAQKLAAYRAAREKAKATLAATQKELKELLTPKQEAILVSSGTLD